MRKHCKSGSYLRGGEGQGLDRRALGGHCVDRVAEVPDARGLGDAAAPMPGEDGGRRAGHGRAWRDRDQLSPVPPAQLMQCVPLQAELTAHISGGWALLHQLLREVKS